MDEEAFHLRGDALLRGALVNASRAAPPSFRCVETVREALSAVAVSVEQQTGPRPEHLAAVRPWGALGENLLNMRMQMASVSAGLELAHRHASAMGFAYHAVARMRADCGDQTWCVNREVFLSEDGWQTMRRRANQLILGVLPLEKRTEVVSCGHPRFKHTDFCQWSVPSEPLRRTIEQLTGDAFERTIYQRSEDGMYADCADYLNATNEKEHKHRMPLVSENVLYCALRAAGLRASTLVDRRPGAV